MARPFLARLFDLGNLHDALLMRERAMWLLTVATSLLCIAAAARGWAWTAHLAERFCLSRWSPGPLTLVIVLLAIVTSPLVYSCFRGSARRGAAVSGMISFLALAPTAYAVAFCRDAFRASSYGFAEIRAVFDGALLHLGLTLAVSTLMIGAIAAYENEKESRQSGHVPSGLAYQPEYSVLFGAAMTTMLVILACFSLFDLLQAGEELRAALVSRVESDREKVEMYKNATELLGLDASGILSGGLLGVLAPLLSAFLSSLLPKQR